MSAYKKQIGGNHYSRFKVQPSKFINDNNLQFAEGNAIKYICRAGHKGSKTEDLEKAIVYLQNELEYAKRQNLSGHHSPDKVVYGGSGLQGGLSPDTISFSEGSFSSKEPYNGGVQGVFGGGGTAIFN